MATSASEPTLSAPHTCAVTLAAAEYVGGAMPRVWYATSADITCSACVFCVVYIDLVALSRALMVQDQQSITCKNACILCVCVWVAYIGWVNQKQRTSAQSVRTQRQVGPTTIHSNLHCVCRCVRGLSVHLCCDVLRMPVTMHALPIVRLSGIVFVTVTRAVRKVLGNRFL